VALLVLFYGFIDTITDMLNFSNSRKEKYHHFFTVVSNNDRYKIEF